MTSGITSAVRERRTDLDRDRSLDSLSDDGFRVVGTIDKGRLAGSLADMLKQEINRITEGGKPARILYSNLDTHSGNNGKNSSYIKLVKY